ncbi:MAG: LETM1-related biofilm-associated protein, partial [Leeuwenhoekiella sp.]
PGILERKYLFDLACLSVWEDEKIDIQQSAFLKNLSERLVLNKAETSSSLAHIHDFITNYRDEISYLNYSNPLKHFYNQTSRTVRILILRNKKRLLNELLNSKDLVVLLGQSTVRELNKSEKKKAKAQLLDICKSIPSLAIFLLPGGTLLLPLLIKLIPELLPSAFDDNRIEREEIE